MRPSSALTEGSMRALTAGWRPMAFGRVAPHRIADPVCEPLWGGRRVLVEVAAGRVDIRDVDGTAVVGYEDLRAAIADGALADELVIDGSLLPAPLRDLEGARLGLGLDALETPADRMRHMLVGQNTVGGRRQPRARSGAAPLAAPGDGPAAFVAADLLWIDGQALIDIPLVERKRLLDSALEEDELVRRTMVVRPPFDRSFARWRALGFEEAIHKAANGRYHPGTVSADWAVEPIPRP